MGDREGAGGDDGGIRGLRLILREHAEAIDADFQRFYGIHLAADLGTPRLRYGRFGALLRQLPVESGYVRAHLPPSTGWTLTDRLVAQAVNELRGLMYVFTKAYGGKPSKPTYIRPPSPASKPDKPRLSLEEMRARLNDPRWVDVTGDPTLI